MPYRLPWYPNDQIILLELSWQLRPSHALLGNKHLAGVPYPVSFGQGLYELHTFQHTDNLEKELAEYHLKCHPSMLRMDPYGKLQKALGAKYSHGHNVEGKITQLKQQGIPLTYSE